MRISGISFSQIIIAVLLTTTIPLQAEDLAIAESLDGKSNVSITSLERKNGIVTVKGRYENKGGSHTYDNHRQYQTFLLDEEKGVKYFIIKDTQGNSLASPAVRSQSTGDTKKFWTKFTAPPTEKKSISLYLDDYDPLEDLPITDK